MAAPSNLTISYGSSSTAVVAIPTTGSGTPIEPTQAIRNIANAGGFWFTDTSGVFTWIPYGQITKVTAQ